MDPFRTLSSLYLSFIRVVFMSFAVLWIFILSFICWERVLYFQIFPHTITPFGSSHVTNDLYMIWVLAWGIFCHINFINKLRSCLTHTGYYLNSPRILTWSCPQSLFTSGKNLFVPPKHVHLNHQYPVASNLVRIIFWTKSWSSHLDRLI